MSIEQVTALLLDSVEELTTAVLRRVWGTPGYDEAHMRPEDLSSKVAPNLRWVIRCLATTGPPEEPAVAAARDIGQSRALQGVPVDAVVQSWAVAERVVLDHLLAHSDVLAPAELRAAARRLGDVVGELTRCSMDAYRQTQEEVTAHYDRLTTDLVARLSGERPADPEAVDRRARTIGSDPTVPHAAVAVGLPAVGSSGGPAAYLRVQRHLLAVIGPRSLGRVLVGSLDERPLMLVPAPAGPRQGLAGLLEASVADRHRPDPVVLGVSEHAAPLHAMGPVCRQAQLAMQVGIQLGWVDRVVWFGAVAPEAMLVRNPDIAALLADRIRPLRERPELLDTIRAWLREGMCARAAARALFVHPNTVQYRLRSIQRLLGRPLTDATALADVILALRGADLQGDRLPPARPLVEAGA